MKRIYFQDNAIIQDRLHDLFQAVAGWAHSSGETEEENAKTVQKSYFDIVCEQGRLIVCEEEQKDDVKCDKPTELVLSFPDGQRMIVRRSAIVALKEEGDSTSIHFTRPRRTSLSRQTNQEKVRRSHPR